MIKEKLLSSSKDTAKERLKNILMRDRVDISREMMESLKTEMIAVTKDYFTVKEHSAEVYLTNMKRNANEESETMLVCLIPIKKSKSVIG